MMKSNKKFEQVAEDFNSPYFRNWLFCLGTSNYKILGIDGPTMGILSRENKIQYFAQMETWTKAHRDLKNKTLKNYDFVEQIIDKANSHGELLNRWTEKNIFKAPLKKFTNKKLMSLYRQYAVLGAKEYTYGVCLPLLDFQGFSFVESAITEFLKKNAPPEKFEHYFSVFTQPIKNSFSQEQEESLLGIIGKHYKSPKWKKDILKSDSAAIQNKYPKFFRDLRRHAKRYAWVYYVYRGPAYTERDFLEFVKHSLKQKVHPSARLKQLAEKKGKISTLKNRYLRELNPPQFHLKMLKLAGKLVWAKPRRKDYQSKSYYHIEKLQKEIGRRLFLSLEQVRSLPLDILEKFLTSGKAKPELANEFFRLHLCVRVGDNKTVSLSGKKAGKLIKKSFKLPKKENAKLFKNQSELIGQTAFAGFARGQVKIINQPIDMHKMNPGDILVSVATTPSLVPAIKKAAAIVTDEGGLTCHASIVSRELEIPCVVGTKIATEVLKDGELVEVDADNGIVKKI
jgi:phosphohistidine swiveling domain-containing protein